MFNHLKNKTILITGASGFVARHLIGRLKQIEHINILLVDKIVGKDDKVDYLDLCNEKQVADYLIGKEINYIFHLAGKIDQRSDVSLYRELLDLHIVSTINLTKHMNSNNFNKFIHVGSNAEYGNATCPQGEQTKEMPNSPYGISKLATTKMLLSLFYNSGFPVVIVRPFSIYGFGQSNNSFLSQAITAAKNGNEFSTTPGEQTRDFISVNQVVKDLLYASSDNIKVGTIINSCTGVALTIKEVLQIIQSKYKDFNPQYGKIPYRETELMQSVGVPFNKCDKQNAYNDLSAFIYQF